MIKKIMTNKKLSRIEIDIYNSIKEFSDKLISEDKHEHGKVSMYDVEDTITFFKMEYRKGCPLIVDYLLKSMKTGSKLLRVGGDKKNDYLSFIEEKYPNLKKIEIEVQK
jgi:hypothetical protein